MEFNKYTERDTLQYCLGATLYMPGTKDIKDKVVNHQLAVTSLVMCCEDAIKEEDLPLAEQNILEHMDYFADLIEVGQLSHDDIPLIFVRVRNPEQFESFAARMTARQASVLTGFNFPKFSSSNSFKVLQTLVKVNNRLGVVLYGMPILEGPEIAFRESRKQELLLLRNILEPYKNLILSSV
jgi:citrate lyase beta subunit